MLLELCIIELEDFALNNNTLLALPQPVIQESAHPYSNQITTNGVVRIPGRFITNFNKSNINKSFSCICSLFSYSGADSLQVEFDRRCSTEKNLDSLTIFDPSRSTVYVVSGREWSDWSVPLFIQGKQESLLKLASRKY